MRGILWNKTNRSIFLPQLKPFLFGEIFIILWLGTWLSSASEVEGIPLLIYEKKKNCTGNSSSSSSCNSRLSSALSESTSFLIISSTRGSESPQSKKNFKIVWFSMKNLVKPLKSKCFTRTCWKTSHAHGLKV